jgi:CarD family transcriptional regulator
MTIMIPTDNADSVGLREIITTQEVKKVYKILKDRDVKIDQTTWNRRYREYMEKIKTGSIYEIAEVLRNLFILRHTKDLSFGERKMLDQAKNLLVKEISLAKQTNEADVEQEIQTIFAS